MPAYVDTRALVKRSIAEVGSTWVRQLLAHPAQSVISTVALAQAEVISALQRRVREGTLPGPQAQRLTQRVAVHCTQRYEVLAITPPLIDQACGMLQAHPLRAADAIHLAGALLIRRITHEQGLPPPCTRPPWRRALWWRIHCRTHDAIPRTW